MNIVIFTPVVAASAIGRMAALVSHALMAQGHSVAVVRTEAVTCHGKPSHDFGIEPLSWADGNAVAAALKLADLAVHQIGNSFDYHVGNLAWLGSASSVVCLHDFYLAHLFNGWAQTEPQIARKELEHWYGPGAADAFFSYTHRVDFIELTSREMPMTEWVVAKASAVIAHSSWGMSRVLAACPGPVWTVPLAYDIRTGHMGGTRALVDPTDELTLLTVGHVNPNKRIESVIRAIGSSDLLRERVAYHLVGLVEPPTVLKLCELALSMNVRFVVSGQVDDATLSDAFIGADLVSCLRWPSLESASASAIEAMLHGKAILVTDTGFYSDLPDDCVVKIAPGTDEVATLRSALEGLVNDPLRVRAIGERAGAWASAKFSAGHYAQRLLDLAPSCQRSGVLRGVGEHFAAMLTSWSGSAVAMADSEVADPLRILTAGTGDVV